MEKKVFNQVTKDLFLTYGFYKKNNKYVLPLKDVTIVVLFRSCRGIKSFNYYFYINELYDDSTPFEHRYDLLIEITMKHTPSLRGYHAHEILYEQYDEKEYRQLLSDMLHSYFDPYKNNALEFLKQSDYCMWLSKKARHFLGLE